MAIVVDAIMTGDWHYVEAIVGPAIETVASGLRHALVAAEGDEFVCGDFASIEARIVLALAGQHDKTALLASGADVYLDMAGAIFGRPVVKSETPLRQIGKNTVLGCGFQMGAAKFLARYCQGRTLEFAKSVIDAYRTVWAPLVPKLWYGLQDAATRAVWDRTPNEAFGVVYALEDRWLTALLPSGRKLWYYNPQPVTRAMPWDKNDIRPAFTYQAWKNGHLVTVTAYGGLLTENVVQALARDLLVSAMFKCRAENIPIVLTVHDEILAEVDKRRQAEQMLKQIMEDRDPWAIELKVPVLSECWSGGRYHK
jgi:DNA polymerase